jgi:hypothetical protein
MNESRFPQPAACAFADDDWIRLEADDIAMSFPDGDLLFLADQFDGQPSAYDQGPPAPGGRRGTSSAARSWVALLAGHKRLAATSAGFELIDDEIPSC